MSTTTNLDATIIGRTFIDIGFGTMIAADEIAAIQRFDQGHTAADDQGHTAAGHALVVENFVPGRGQIRWLIKLKSGHWFASLLSERELNYRLRKAGGTLI